VAGMAQREAEGNSARPRSNDPVVLAEWSMNRRERVRVSIEEFKGSRLISIRKWFVTDGGDLRPTKRGISLALRHLPQLADAVEAALMFASAHKLIEIKRLDEVGMGGVSRETIGERARVPAAE
jgi:hypothetical protein